MAGVPLGTRTFMQSGEALSATALAPVLRQKAVTAELVRPADHDVPVRSFQDDLVRKMRLKRVMGHGDKLDGEMPEKGDQFEKEEVNYRYSGKDDESCGACKYFREPGACVIVAGLIRPVDVCDKFAVAPQSVQSYLADDGAEYDENGPQDVGGFRPLRDRRASEVAPPGYEPVVKALKKQPEIDNPWAVAWSMKSRGIRPKKKGKKTALRGSTEQVYEEPHKPMGQMPWLSVEAFTVEEVEAVFA